jgi:hypothetical protein
MSGEFWMPFAQVRYSDHLLSVVRLSVNFYIFDFFSRTTGPILIRLGTDHPWVKGFQVSSNEGDRPSPRGDISKKEKMHCVEIFKKKSSSPESAGQIQSNLKQIILG